MKIVFNRIGPKERYPLSRRELIEYINRLDKQIAGLVHEIKVNCSKSTSHEGTLSVHNGKRRIIVNFFVNNDNTSHLVDPNKMQFALVKSYGGIVDGTLVKWTTETAKRYFMGILFHEVAHLVYLKSIARNERNSFLEENWCNAFAKMAVDFVFGDSQVHPYATMVNMD